MPSGYVKFSLPTILHNGLERFDQDMSKSEFRILEKNGWLFEGRENPAELGEKRLYFYEKYSSTREPLWDTYIIYYKGYRVAIASCGGPLEETTYVLPEHLFEL